jgi:hypothetical protein
MKGSGTNALASFNVAFDWNVMAHMDRHTDAAHAHTS